MYKKIEKILIVASVFLLTSLSLFIVIHSHKQMFAGADGGVLVLNARSDLKDQLKKLATEQKVLIAKQIMVPTTDGKTENQPTFQVFGSGKLPKDFPEQVDPAFLEKSNDAVHYFIFGAHLSAQSLVNELNASGNTAIIADNDWRFQGITALLDQRLIAGTLLFLISYISLLMADTIINLKKRGIQRLAGQRILALAFSGLVTRLLWALGATLVAFTVSTIVLFHLNLTRTMYFYVILYPGVFWLLSLFVVELIVGSILFIFLKKQQLNLIIKDRVPLTTLMSLVLSLQLIALLSLIFSFTSIHLLNTEIQTLSKAKTYWEQEDYYSTSMLSGDDTPYYDATGDFLADAYDHQDMMLVADNFNKNPVPTQYFPTSEGNENVLYVTPNYLAKVGLKEEASTIQDGPSDAVILIPTSEKKQSTPLFKAWSNTLSSLAKEDTSLKISTMSYQMPSEELFTYRIFGWSAPNQQAFVKNPIILVFTPQLFYQKKLHPGFLFTWLSHQQLLFSNNKKTAQSIKSFGLENILGSFSSGQMAVSTRLAEKKNLQLFMLVTSGIALISGMFLFYLMNRIYLYQNRKKFAVYRLAGRSILGTHKSYLAKLFGILVFAIFLIMALGLPLETFFVPLLFTTLQLGLFKQQLSQNNAISVAVLKGE